MIAGRSRRRRMLKRSSKVDDDRLREREHREDQRDAQHDAETVERPRDSLRAVTLRQARARIIGADRLSRGSAMYSRMRLASPPAISSAIRPSRRKTTRRGAAGGAGVVGDHQDRVARLRLDVAQHVEHRGAVLGVEVSGRLVGQEQCRDRASASGRPRRAAARRRRAARAGARARSERPTRSSSSWARSCRFDALSPAISDGSITFSSAVSVRQQVEELEDEADRVAAQQRELLVVEADDALAADRDARRRWWSQARRGCASACSCRIPTDP